MTKPFRRMLVAVVLLVGAAVTGIWAIKRGPALDTTATTGLNSQTDVEMLPGDLQFSDPEKEKAHYATVVAGERRALAKVEDALAKAGPPPAGGAVTDYARKLETMRSDYQRRIRVHALRAGEGTVVSAHPAGR